MKRIFQDNKKLTDLGLLILRVGIGLIFIKHGFPKLLTGTEKWIWMGSQLKHLGITFAPLFFGFLAVCAEFFGGIALVLGLGTRIAAFFMADVMFVAVVMHYSQGDAFGTIAHPLSLLVVFLSLMIMGGGSYSLDSRFK